MIVKVCGMRDEANIADVSSLGIDMMGFIFYDLSSRYVGDSVPQTPKGVKRVGVFVNSSIDYIMEMIKSNSLDFVQLHGSERPEMCQILRDYNVGVIKAISVSSSDDIELAKKYADNVDYLLFDTKCDNYGGSGRSFDWNILRNYNGSTPFILSGGIDENMSEEIKTISHDKFVGIDLNSRFEDQPALKNVGRLRSFINKIK